MRNVADHFRQYADPPHMAVNMFIVDHISLCNNMPLLPRYYASEVDVEPEILSVHSDSDDADDNGIRFSASTSDSD